MVPATPHSTRQLVPGDQSARHLTRSAPSLTSTSGQTSSRSSAAVTPTGGKGVAIKTFGSPSPNNSSADSLSLSIYAADTEPFVQQTKGSESSYDPFAEPAPVQVKSDDTESTHQTVASQIHTRIGMSTMSAAIPPGGLNAVPTMARIKPAIPGLNFAVNPNRGIAPNPSQNTAAGPSMVNPNLSNYRFNAADPTQSGPYALPDPEMCLFVGNLPSSLTDLQLVMKLKPFFDRFGLATYDIRHDRKGLSTAFIQYFNRRAVSDALEHGNDCVIDERKCRVEQAVVRRTLSFLRRDSQPVDYEAVLQDLCKFGPINFVFVPSPMQVVMWKLQAGAVYYQFTYHAHSQCALDVFRRDKDYIVDLAELNADLTDTLPSIEIGDERLLWAGGLPRDYPEKFPAILPAPGPLGEIVSPIMDNKMECTILIENLPSTITCHDLCTYFSMFGQIVHINISVDKPTFGPVVHAQYPGIGEVAATIEYNNPRSASHAMAVKNFSQVKGRLVKIEAQPMQKRIAGLGYRMSPTTHIFNPVGCNRAGMDVVNATDFSRWTHSRN